MIRVLDPGPQTTVQDAGRRGQLRYGIPPSGPVDARSFTLANRLAGNSDVQVGDLLTTSGVDGVYPGGLRVAVVEAVERQADSTFARIYCRPFAQLTGVRHVMVLEPLRPAAESAAVEPPAPKVTDPNRGAYFLSRPTVRSSCWRCSSVLGG